MFDGGAGNPRTATRAGGFSTGSKLHISNLDFGVSDSDIKVSAKLTVYISLLIPPYVLLIRAQIVVDRCCVECSKFRYFFRWGWMNFASVVLV